MSRVHAWCFSFAVTVAVKIAIAGKLLRRDAPSRRARLGAITVANLATHPLVWFALPVFHLEYTSELVVAEAYAIAMETCIYACLSPRAPWLRATAASAFANAASYMVGLVVASIPSFARAAAG